MLHQAEMDKARTDEHAAFVQAKADLESNAQKHGLRAPRVAISMQLRCEPEGPGSRTGGGLPDLDLSCEPSCKLQECLWPSGPEIPKKSEKKKSLPGPPALGSQKVWKKSRKGPKSLEKVSKMSAGDFSHTFSRLFGTPQETFFRLFWHFGPGGHERLL